MTSVVVEFGSIWIANLAHFIALHASSMFVICANLVGQVSGFEK